MNIWDNLPKPFFVLAPMDDITDTVFRQIIASLPYPADLSGVQGVAEERSEAYQEYVDQVPEAITQQSVKNSSRVGGYADKSDAVIRGYGAPDLFFTEFVNVDGLQSPGREKLIPKLMFTETERPIIAQIWGKNPENYYKTAQDLVEMGYDGIDINMGCPVKTVVRDGCCAAMMNNRELAVEIIQATREGAGTLPLSVKTRTGYSGVDLTWHELLLGQKLEALIIHGRTKAQMSKVPADWDIIEQIREFRDATAPETKIVGNGDVQTRSHGLELVKKYKLDGIMIGRGIFDDPFVFADKSSWPEYTRQQKMNLYRQHVELFAKTWQKNERKLITLNKFCKIYINGFDGAKDLREKLMSATSVEELLKNLS